MKRQKGLEELHREMYGETGGAGSPKKQTSAPVLIPLAAVQRKPVPWLVRGWIPRGTLSLIDGDPGLGKSTLALDLAARVSRGDSAPPGLVPECGPSGVLLLSAEDDAEYTIAPRLDAAKADQERVHLFDCIKIGEDERPVVLPSDLEMVEGKAKELGVALVVVDPLFAYLDDQYDGHKDQQVRQALRRLAGFAKRTGVAVLVVRHLNKLNGGPALYRGGGSIGIVGAARCALLVGRDPNNPEVNVLAMNKKNIGPPPKSLAFSLESVSEDIARVGWIGETDLTKDDILWHDAAKGKPSAEVQEAHEFLRDLLSGAPVDAAKVCKEAHRAGISIATLKRAKADLGIRSIKTSGTGPWVWRFDHDQGAQQDTNFEPLGPDSDVTTYPKPF